MHSMTYKILLTFTVYDNEGKFNISTSTIKFAQHAIVHCLASRITSMYHMQVLNTENNNPQSKISALLAMNCRKHVVQIKCGTVHCTAVMYSQIPFKVNS